MSRYRITARLRSEATARLPKLLRLYAPDAQATSLIQNEIIRRQRLAGETITLPTPKR